MRCRSSHNAACLCQVVMATQPRGAVDLDLDEDKRRAIMGAMKNIRMEYTPEWAALVPEQAWMRVLTERQPQTTATAQQASGRRRH